MQHRIKQIGITVMTLGMMGGFSLSSQASAVADVSDSLETRNIVYSDSLNPPQVTQSSESNVNPNLNVVKMLDLFDIIKTAKTTPDLLPSVVENYGGDDDEGPIYYPITVDESIYEGYVEGGEIIVLTGTHLDRVARVAFGTILGEIIGKTETNLTVKVPAHLEGTIPIKVIEGTGVETEAGRYTYLKVTPTFGLVSPQLGSVEGGSVISINGQGMLKVKKVTFGGIEAQIESYPNDYFINVSTPASVSIGTVPIEFFDVNGTLIPTDRVINFNYVDDIQVYYLTPGRGTGGSIISIFGVGLNKISDVKVDGISANIEYKQDYVINFVLPDHDEGIVNVELYDNNENLVKTLEFNYDQTTMVSFISPLTVIVGDSLAVNGSGLKKVGKITVDGQEAYFEIIDEFSILVYLPDHTIGPAEIKVFDISDALVYTGSVTYVEPSLVE